MEHYLPIIREAFPSALVSDLTLPIKETQIDSLDLVVIRVSFEKYFDLEVSDPTWYSFHSLAEAIAYFQTHAPERGEKEITCGKKVTKTENIEVRMPQMANSSLSEHWLLSCLGDMHWVLLSSGLEQNSSQIKDDENNRLYATFINATYSTAPLNHYCENDIINFNAELCGYGGSTYLSKIIGCSGTNEIKANLVTSFSVREGDNNSKIHRGMIPSKNAAKIEQIIKPPVQLNEHRLLKKGLLEHISSPFGDFEVTDSTIWECEYCINPFHDINGVGLLYFASYPIISDRCTIDYFKCSDRDSCFSSFNTIHRDIFYFANCNTDDKIIYRLNAFKSDGKIVKMSSSLYRKSDQALLARIFTIKERGI